MAKVIFKPHLNSQITFEVMADKEIDLFHKISRLQEVFGESSCGMCDSPDICYVTRKVKKKDNTEFFTHEVNCRNCGGRLPFGVHNNGEGTLFAKRSDNKTNRGWLPAFQGGTPIKAKAEPPVEWQPQDLSQV